MWLNRKSTDNSQLLHSLEERLKALETDFEAEKSANRRNLLEYADLGEKTRRLYLRIARRQKIEEETTSAPENGEPAEIITRTPEEIREAIERKMGM